MNGDDWKGIGNTLERAALRSRARITEAFNDDRDPEALDVVTLQLERLYQAVIAPRGQGPKQMLREHGPYVGYGAGLGAVLVALFEALGRIFGQ